MTDPASLSPGFSGLVEILARLRAPDGCPWDREQTHESLLRYLWEEAAEVSEAVRAQDSESLADELGDVLLQVVFHAQLATEAGHFTIDDVIEGISSKMIRRHPHVFGSATAETPEAVKSLWQEIKKREKAASGKTQPTSVLDQASKGLPGLMRAQALQAQAARVGFSWPDPTPAFSKVKEELSETEREWRKGDQRRLAEEYGDLLFAVAALGRQLDLDAEQELVHGNAKFEARFRSMETTAGGSEALAALGSDELLRRWNRLKPESLLGRSVNLLQRRSGLKS